MHSIKKIVFKSGYFNVTNAKGIEWDTHLQGARAKRLGEEPEMVMRQFIATWEGGALDAAIRAQEEKLESLRERLLLYESIKSSVKDEGASKELLFTNSDMIRGIKRLIEIETEDKEMAFREISKRKAELQTDEALPATREDDVHRRLYLTGTSDPIQTRL